MLHQLPLRFSWSDKLRDALTSAREDADATRRARYDEIAAEARLYPRDSGTIESVTRRSES